MKPFSEFIAESMDEAFNKPSEIKDVYKVIHESLKGKAGYALTYADDVVCIRPLTEDDETKIVMMIGEGGQTININGQPVCIVSKDDGNLAEAGPKRGQPIGDNTMMVKYRKEDGKYGHVSVEIPAGSGIQSSYIASDMAKAAGYKVVTTWHAKYTKSVAPRSMKALLAGDYDSI